ncbi:hypothetical protein [Streptomyces tanashiensis]|uniref:hypothetical protein n=1 Tax=Streptomyces tanashiensis TaxID=67367 RepID=UPI0033D4D749
MLASGLDTYAFRRIVELVWAVMLFADATTALGCERLGKRGEARLLGRHPGAHRRWTGVMP